MQTVWDHIRLAAERTPRQLALVDDLSARSLTFEELINYVEDVAAGLALIGVEAKKRVATVLPNIFEHVIGILAFHRLGTQVCMINPRLKPEQAVSLMESAGVTAVICPPDPNFISNVKNRLPNNTIVFTIGDLGDGAIDFCSCKNSLIGVSSWLPAERSEEAFILYTSGTTGLPKGVMVSHGATDARVIYAIAQCGLRHGSHNRAIGLMPLFHAVGFYSSLITTLSLNGTYYIHSAFDAGDAITTIFKKKITFVYGSPAHFHAILSAKDFSREKMESVETLVYAGSAMSGPLLERVGVSFPNAQITNIYGTTETMNSLYMPDPVGKPMHYRPGFYSNVRVVRVESDINDLCEIEEEGELLVDASAEATFSGYLGNTSATSEKLVQGWYRTGDVFVKLANGDFELRGRVDDMIVSGGENIHPEEVEGVLIENKLINEVAVIGLPDEQWFERVIACIVSEDKTIDGDVLDAWCRASSLPDYKRPRQYIFLESLPRNAANKIMRPQLKELVITMQGSQSSK